MASRPNDWPVWYEGSNVVQATGTSTNGGSSLTGMSSISGISSGMFVSGPGIVAGTTVNGTPSGTTVPLSQNAGSGAGSGNFVFGTNLAAPSLTKRSNGWAVGEKPASQFLNYIIWLISIWIDWFDEQVQFNYGLLPGYIVGSSAQVTAGVANYSSVQSAINAAVAAGGAQVIRILPGTYTENITIANSQLTILGVGQGSYVNGTWTLNTGATKCLIEKIRMGGTLTVNSGAQANFIHQCWIANGASLVNNAGAGAGNSIIVVQE